jgi:hypothetical protein
MFDREAAITAWRERLAAAGGFFESDLDELCDHLRDHLDALEEVGIEGEEAWKTALESIGEAAALAGEYAKVNRSLAWRTPLSFIATGALSVVVAAPVFRTMSSGLLHAGAAMGLPVGVLRAIVWTFVLGAPSLFFGVLLRDREASFAWMQSAPRRVIVLASIAAIAIAGIAGPSLLVLAGVWHDSKALDAVSFTEWRAMQVVGSGAPCAIVAYVLGTRMAGERTSNTSWLALGCLVPFAGSEIALLARYASFAGAGAVHAGFDGIRTMAWIVTIAVPLALVFAARTWVVRRAPLPDEMLHGRGFPAALLAMCGVSIIGPLTWGPLIGRAFGSLAVGAGIEAFRAEAQARVVVTAMLVVAIGGWIMSARSAARAR